MLQPDMRHDISVCIAGETTLGPGQGGPEREASHR
jgi:hypothetical protein